MTLAELEAGKGDRVSTLADELDVSRSTAYVDIVAGADTLDPAVFLEAGYRTNLRWADSSLDHDVQGFPRGQSSAIDPWPLALEATDDTTTTLLGSGPR